MSAEKRRFVVLMVAGENDGTLVGQTFAEEAHRCDFEIDLRSPRDGAELLAYLDQCKSGEGAEGPPPPAPDFILLDLNMPAAGGREILKKAMSHPLCRRTPIIAFSKSADRDGVDDADDVIECYRCGGSSFRRKPRNPDNLGEMARIIVERRLCSAHLPDSPPFSCMGYG